MTRSKRIAAVVGALSGLLAVIMVAQRFGLGSGHSLDSAGSSGSEPALLAAIDKDALKLEPWESHYKSVVLDRPLFNESRTPEAVEGIVAEVNPDQALPLNVLLTGVIMAHDLSLAIVRDNTTNESQRVRVGQPLMGDQGGWKLVEISARGAVFEGAGLGRQPLELKVDTKGGPAPVPAAPVNVPPQVAQQPGMPMPPPGTPAAQPVGQPASAEEIRQRIEERRRQLREEAQRMLEQQNQNKQ